MKDKKAKSVTLMDLRGLKGPLADFFVICTGTSDTQIGAISKSIEEKVYKSHQEDPKFIEGKQNNQWVLIDYTDVVAHVFMEEKREFYGLEDLWGDAKITHFEDEE